MTQRDKRRETVTVFALRARGARMLQKTGERAKQTGLTPRAAFPGPARASNEAFRVGAARHRGTGPRARTHTHTHTHTPDTHKTLRARPPSRPPCAAQRVERRGPPRARALRTDCATPGGGEG